MVSGIVTAYALFLFEQGSYPFSPFAMPSPNGIAEASVSYNLQTYRI